VVVVVPFAVVSGESDDALSALFDFESDPRVTTTSPRTITATAATAIAKTLHGVFGIGLACFMARPDSDHG
jgi:hypothetical protein